jgi:hypothetical protein
MPLSLKVTNAGLALISQAGTLGPVVISELAIGSGTWSTTPTGAETSLKTQIKRIPLVGDVPTAGTIHLSASDETTDTYSVYEVGLYTSTNVLFAIGGQSSVYLTKASTSNSLFSFDLVVSNYPAGTITVGNTNFLFTQATETVTGIAEIATQAEVTTGTDDARIVTPKKLATANYLSKSGGTMTGNLILNADPTVSLQSATKNYVDSFVYNKKKVFPFSVTENRTIGNGTWTNNVIWSESSVCGFKQIQFSFNSILGFWANNGDNDGQMSLKLELIAKADAEANEYILASAYWNGNGRPFSSVQFIPQTHITPSDVDLTNKKLKIRVTGYTGWGGDWFGMATSAGHISYEGIGTSNGSVVIATPYTSKVQTATGETGSYVAPGNWTKGGIGFIWGSVGQY